MSSSAVPTLRCSWSWAWCWRVNFSCCFWNSLMSSCFWICCCFWMRSSSCCSCLSHSPGSEPGPSILRSVRRSSGDKGSTLSGTSVFTSTEAHKVDCKQRKREKQIAFYFYRFKSYLIFFGDEEDETVAKPWKREKIQNHRERYFHSCDPQKHVIIIASINKHWIALASARSLLGAAVQQTQWTSGTKCWSGRLKSLHKCVLLFAK